MINFSFALLALVGMEHVNGHGYVHSPRSRNWFAVEEGVQGVDIVGLPDKEYCPDCLNTNELPNGICGKPAAGSSYTEYLDSDGNEMPWISQETYTAGQQITVKQTFTAHHYGHVFLSACDLGKQSKQDCFDNPNNWLEFVNDNFYNMPKDNSHPERGYLKRGFMEHEMVFKLPDNVSGDQVLIQWRYITANSCLPEGYHNYFNSFIGDPNYNVVTEDWKGPNMQNCDKYPQDGSKPDGGAPEQFWNCVEVTINPGTPTPPPVPTPPTPPPTASPVSTPAPVPIVPNPTGIPFPCCSWHSDFCDQPDNNFCHESKSNCETLCSGVYRDPYSQPPPTPTGPNPTTAPVPVPPTASPPTSIPTTGIPCCSDDFKRCINWVDNNEAACLAANYYWLPWGAPVDPDSCIAITYSCVGHGTPCCPGMICNPDTASAPCIVDTAPPVNSPTLAPVSMAPVSNNTPQPVPIETTAPVLPNNEGGLFSTDQSLSVWDAFRNLDSLTYEVSTNPLVYALQAEGGAAGSGNVVTESQAYGLLITSIVLASWETHSTSAEGADWHLAVKYFEGYFNGWKMMCFASTGTCQSSGDRCQDTVTGQSAVCLPGWKHSGDLSSEIGSGAAPDGDEDAILGMILAIKAFDGKEKPEWYDELRKWADSSCTSFLQYNTVVKDQHRILKLGSCWGGWGNDGNNPSYHSPGSFKVMRDYHTAFPDSERDYTMPSFGSGSLEDHWNKLIETSYEVLSATQCPDQGMVPNWATVDIRDSEIVHTGGSFSGSGTPQWEYGSEAARTTWRVAVDAALYPNEMNNAAKPYLDPILSSLESGYNPSLSLAEKYFESSAISSCQLLSVDETIYAFSSGWKWNDFIFGPTVSSLVVPIDGVTESNQQEIIDLTGYVLSTDIPSDYYPRCWAVLSILTLNGAIESAGRLLSTPSMPTPPPATLAPVRSPTPAPVSSPSITPTLAPITPSLAPVRSPTPAPVSPSPITPTLAPITPSLAPVVAPVSVMTLPCCGWSNDGTCEQPTNTWCHENESQCTGACNGNWYTADGPTPAPTQANIDSGCCTWGGWSVCPTWTQESSDPCQMTSAGCANCSGAW
eukprot:CAMPEP_0194227352 /NCGR_PEP_ID=MMETSP0156-20130528/42813_1 /TAXON_ID=33649 /ORGANISM="Thalassionema nitzschioides, Strain L26-B" /LENGTH=1087 /DNA_ID=CAMNT_0038959831 /DNA_START=53 /DNA_END=3313 /DNA_ORIENTATION=+